MKTKIKPEHLFISIIVLFLVIAAAPFLIWGENLAGWSIKISSCTDSDAKDYYTAGEVALKYIFKGSTVTKISSDVCVNDDIVEYICSQGNLKKIKYTCLHGCSNGACAASKCIDSDEGKDYKVKGTAVFSGKVDETKIDYCLNAKTLNEYFCAGQEEIRAVEYICPQGCENGVCLGSLEEAKGCEDTDKGVDYHTKGFITTSDGRTQTDYCRGIKLTEYYCTKKGIAMVEFYTCPNGCEDGACISSP